MPPLKKPTSNWDRVMAQKIALILQDPFFGSLILHLKLKESNNSKTFKTDGKFIYVPTDKFKWETFTDVGIKTILAHEVLHCALLHIYRRGSRTRERWYMACDYAINGILAQQRGKFSVEHGLLNPAFFGKGAEEIYNLLSPDAGKDLSDDDMDMMESSGGDDEGEQGEEREDDGAGDLDDILNQGKERKNEESKWKNALASASEQHRGHIPAGLSELIDEILAPKLPWQEILYNQIKNHKGQSDYQWYPFNRAHVYRDICLPTLTGDGIEVVVHIDTSGSISNEQAGYFLGEIWGLCSLFGEFIIHFFTGDCELTITNQIIDNEGDIPNVIVGRGGTSFVPLFKAITELELDSLPVLVFTDCDGDYPAEPYPNTYFIVVEGQRWNKEPPFGMVLEIPKEEAPITGKKGAK